MLYVSLKSMFCISFVSLAAAMYSVCKHLIQPIKHNLLHETQVIYLAVSVCAFFRCKDAERLRARYRHTCAHDLATPCRWYVGYFTCFTHQHEARCLFDLAVALVVASLVLI